MDLTDAVEALPEPVLAALARRLAPALREHLEEEDSSSCTAAEPITAEPRASLPPSLVDDVWFSTAEAAAYTRRHPETVLKAAAAATVLQSAQAGRGRTRRYRKEWLDEWLGLPAAPVGEGRGR